MCERMRERERACSVCPPKMLAHHRHQAKTLYGVYSIRDVVQCNRIHLYLLSRFVKICYASASRVHMKLQYNCVGTCAHVHICVYNTIHTAVSSQPRLVVVWVVSVCKRAHLENEIEIKIRCWCLPSPRSRCGGA